MSVFGEDEEGGLRQVVFCGNGLESLVVNLCIQQANRRRIAGKNIGSKGVNLVNRYSHFRANTLMRRKVSKHLPSSCLVSSIILLTMNSLNGVLSSSGTRARNGTRLG